jgi:hypothetical protein
MKFGHYLSPGQGGLSFVLREIHDSPSIEIMAFEGPDKLPQDPNEEFVDVFLLHAPFIPDPDDFDDYWSRLEDCAKSHPSTTFIVNDVSGVIGIRERLKEYDNMEVYGPGPTQLFDLHTRTSALLYGVTKEIS